MSGAFTRLRRFLRWLFTPVEPRDLPPGDWQ